LTDQALLADVATNARFEQIRMAAAGRLDESYRDVAIAIYADIAQNTDNADMLKAAIQGLAELRPAPPVK